MKNSVRYKPRNVQVTGRPCSHLSAPRQAVPKHIGPSQSDVCVDGTLSFTLLRLSLSRSLHCSVVIQLSTPFIIPPLSPAQNYYFFDVLLVENKSISLAINLSFGMGSHT